MYQVDEKDKVIELKNVPQSSVGAPLPILLSDEHKILLAYLLQPNCSNPPTIEELEKDESIAIVEFNHGGSLMFGSPNDEAFEGHPLESRGLHPYGIFEIENSSWLRQLEWMNSVHPRHNPENSAGYKHFIFAFHDSTFECIAKSFEISILEGSLQSILSEMQKRLVENWNY